MDSIKGAAKAVVAFVYGGGAWIAATLPDLGSFGDLTTGQWLSAFLAALVGAGLIYTVPNAE
jgi:hypothetical protein